MDLGVRNQAALVTGGTHGIGRAIAIALAEEGVDVGICARTQSDLDSTVALLKEHGSRALGLRVNGMREEEVRQAVEQFYTTYGRLDVLINNAGGDGAIKPILDLTENDWQQDFRQNFLVTVHFCRAAVPFMKEKRYGRIVNISSVAGTRPGPMFTPYCVAKSAVMLYSKALAEAVASDGILVNALMPGIIDTRQMKYVETTLATAQGLNQEQVHSSFANGTLLGRYGTPQEVANVAVFLASPLASYITSTIIAVDGGLLR
jgi:NAD(P)-dependent dehydrogenase (short-subunit alcohol dehydrogenase family)